MEQDGAQKEAMNPAREVASGAMQVTTADLQTQVMAIKTEITE